MGLLRSIKSIFNPEIRALALYILFKERPDLISDAHKTEFGELMEPVFRAEQENLFEEWYARTNPER